MRKLVEYLAHAEDCRKMARQSNNPVHCEQLTNMAVTWDQLADARRRQLKRQGLTAEQDGLSDQP